LTDLERMLALQASGMQYREIARQTGHTYSQVYRALNPEYVEAANQKRRKKRSSAWEQEREELRDRISRLQHELEIERAKATVAMPMALTELHEWWLATKTPDEIVRIASGLAGWEMEAA